MLNFNTIDNNANAFTHSMSLHGEHFTDAPSTTMITSSPHQAHSQAQQISLNYIAANGNGDQANWTHPEPVHRASNTTHDENCNRNNKNLSNSSEAVCGQPQKEYLQTVISNDDSDGQSNLNMGNYLQQKGSENVKRFSVNNLLQLANNCRALVGEQRISTGKHKKYPSMAIEFHFIRTNCGLFYQ